MVIVDRYLHRAGRAALDTINEDDPVHLQLRAYLGGDIEFHFQASLFDDLAEEPAVRRLIERHFRYVMTIIERLVTEGIERGELREVNPALVAATIAGAALYMSQPEVADRVGLAKPEPVNDMLDLILPGLTR